MLPGEHTGARGERELDVFDGDRHIAELIGVEIRRRPFGKRRWSDLRFGGDRHAVSAVLRFKSGHAKDRLQQAYGRLRALVVGTSDKALAADAKRVKRLPHQLLQRQLVGGNANGDHVGGQRQRKGVRTVRVYYVRPDDAIGRHRTVGRLHRRQRTIGAPQHRRPARHRRCRRHQTVAAIQMNRCVPPKRRDGLGQHHRRRIDRTVRVDARLGRHQHPRTRDGKRGVLPVGVAVGGGFGRCRHSCILATSDSGPYSSSRRSPQATILDIAAADSWMFT